MARPATSSLPVQNHQSGEITSRHAKWFRSGVKAIQVTTSIRCSPMSTARTKAISPLIVEMPSTGNAPVPGQEPLGTNRQRATSTVTRRDKYGVEDSATSEQLNTEGFTADNRVGIKVDPKDNGSSVQLILGSLSQCDIDLTLPLR